MIGVGLAVAGPLDDERGYGGGRDGDPRARVLAALADAGVVAPGLCHAAVQLLAVSGGSVSLLTEGRYGATLCVSDEVAARLEALYLTLGEGPGLDAHHHGRPVLEVDLAGADPDRWPSFTEYALKAGARAVFAFPLRLGAMRVGVLGLYRTTAGPLSDTGNGDALLLADFATRAVLALASQTETGDLLGPVAFRTEVHQATGMVAAQTGSGLEDAFARMQAHAYTEGRLINDVAIDVVTGLLRFDPAG